MGFNSGFKGLNIFYRNMSEWCLSFVYAFDIVHVVDFSKRTHWPEMHWMDKCEKKMYVVLIRNTQQPDFFAVDGWTCGDKRGWLLTVDSSLTQGTGMCFVVMKFSFYRSWGFKLAVQKPTLKTAVGTSESVFRTLFVRSVPLDAIYMSVSADTLWFVCIFWWTIDCQVFPPITILSIRREIE